MRADIDGCGALAGRAERGPARKLAASLLALAGGHATLLRHAEQPWASITFTGTRHQLSLAFLGTESIEAGEAFIAAVPDHEFVIRGQLVADAAIKAVDHLLLPEPRLNVVLELLLLEDG